MDWGLYCGRLHTNGLDILSWTANWKCTGNFIVNSLLEMKWKFYCVQLTGNGLGILLFKANWNWTGDFILDS